jgi:hypothetical protein
MATTSVNDRVIVVPRKQFVAQFGDDYQSGQHVTLLGPSGRGKTRLVGQLLYVCATPDHQATLLHGKIKGRDKTIERLSAGNQMPIITTGLPSPYESRIRYRNRHGWVVRPLTKAGESTDEENELLRREFAKSIRANYHTSGKRPRITVVNEAHQAHQDLGLRRACEGPLMRGRPDNAMWSEVQRGRYVSYMVYDQAEHVFVFYDPDESNQKRYSEIGGGADPQQIKELVDGLKGQTRTVADGSTISPCVYFRRSGNVLCIVGT